MKTKNRIEAMDRAMNKILSMPDKEFKELLKENENGNIAKILLKNWK
jgi:hypothetical protein